MEEMNPGETMEEIYRQFQSETDKLGRPLSQLVGRSEVCSNAILNNNLETISTLESITNELKTFMYGHDHLPRLNKTQSNFNLMTLKDDLNTRVDALKASAELAKQDKEEKRAAKVSLQNKILELKRDMDEALDENHQMEQLLSEGKPKDLPLVLRLMSSKDHQ